MNIYKYAVYSKKLYTLFFYIHKHIFLLHNSLLSYLLKASGGTLFSLFSSVNTNIAR